MCRTRERWTGCQKSARRLEERWTFLHPRGSDWICPTPCADSNRHIPLGEWMAGITLLASQGWYLACIISFFPQFSIVKSSIKLDWACLSRPVLECSGEITLKGTRPWLSGRLVHASSQAQRLTLQRSCDILEGSSNAVGPSSQLLSLPGLQTVITPGSGHKTLFYFLFYGWIQQTEGERHMAGSLTSNVNFWDNFPNRCQRLQGRISTLHLQPVFPSKVIC